MPAALALAERNRQNGAALLRAVVLGYDVGTRLTMSLDLTAFYARGHHPPCFGGLFCAAGAAGVMARLDPERVRYMLSYTAQQAGGLSHAVPRPRARRESLRHGRHDGAQRRAGGTACGARIYRRRGCVLRRPQFFLCVFTRCERRKLVRELGKTYEIMNTSIKKWPVGGPILAPLDAVETSCAARFQSRRCGKS